MVGEKAEKGQSLPLINGLSGCKCFVCFFIIRRQKMFPPFIDVHGSDPQVRGQLKSRWVRLGKVTNLKPKPLSSSGQGWSCFGHKGKKYFILKPDLTSVHLIILVCS